MLTGEKRSLLLRRLAIMCAILVLAITSLSAFIRLSNAGLGCADWPQCYGSKLRQAQQGIATTNSESQGTVVARILHRIVAVAALLVIIFMVMACFADKPLLWHEGRMALALLVLALFLAALGRWSGGARVPAINVGNLLGGFAMLALCWRLQRRATGLAVLQGGPRLRIVVWVSVAVLLGQIALGGLVSAGFAGLSCTGFASCGADPSWVVSFEALNPWREPVFPATIKAPANSAGAALHMAHRFGALLLMPAIGFLAWLAIRSGRGREGRVLLWLFAIELVLGVSLVALSLPLGVALAHNLVAALLLAAALALVGGAHPSPPPQNGSE